MTRQGARRGKPHGRTFQQSRIWSSAIQQHGGVLVDTIEGMLDFVMMAVSKRSAHGPVSVFSVREEVSPCQFTDLAARAGLSLPELGAGDTENDRPEDQGDQYIHNQSRRSWILRLRLHVMAHTIRALAKDSNIDVIIPYFSADYIAVAQLDKMERGPEAIIRAADESTKPVIPVLSKFAETNMAVERVRVAVFSAFRKAGLPGLRNHSGSDLCHREIP